MNVPRFKSLLAKSDFDVVVASSLKNVNYTSGALGVPVLYGPGLGHGGGRSGPNEFFVIEGAGKVSGLVECEKSHVDILYSYAAFPDPY
jgi:hypothetical protein